MPRKLMLPSIWLRVRSSCVSMGTVCLGSDYEARAFTGLIDVRNGVVGGMWDASWAGSDSGLRGAVGLEGAAG